MKKTIALILLALFLFSMVPIYAHEDKEDMLVPVGMHEDKEDILQNSKPLVKPSLIVENKDKGILIDNGGLIPPLGSISERKNFVKGRLVAVDEDLVRARDVFHTTKGMLFEIKEFCRKNPENIRCNGELSDTSKKYLENLADTILKVLEKRKTKLEDLRLDVEDSELENKDELIGAIDKRLVEVNNRIATINKITIKIEGATTREELRELAVMLKEEWRIAKNYLKVSGGAIVADRFAGLLYKTDKLEEKLDRTLKRLSGRGFDISNIQDKVDSFNGHLDEARKLVGYARTKFVEAKFPSDANVESVKEGTNFLREAQEHLKMAHKELKEIVKLIKTAGEDLEDETNDVSVPTING